MKEGWLTRSGHVTYGIEEDERLPSDPRLLVRALDRRRSEMSGEDLSIVDAIRLIKDDPHEFVGRGQGWEAGKRHRGKEWRRYEWKIRTSKV